MNDPAFKAELLSWIRFNQNHSNATRDGLSYAVMGAPNLPAWISRPIIRAMLNAKRHNRSDRAKIASSSHLLLIASTEDNPATWLATGRTLQRTLLALTQHGIAHTYLNAPSSPNCPRSAANNHKSYCASATPPPCPIHSAEQWTALSKQHRQPEKHRTTKQQRHK